MTRSAPCTAGVALRERMAHHDAGHAVETHALPRLPYGFAALEPHIDERTMVIHYRKHHLEYVRSLNALVLAYPALQRENAEWLCRNLAEVPQAIREDVRIAAGGHWNHSRLWAWMTPASGGAPFGISHDAIVRSFGSFARFKDEFTTAAIRICGSGWAWLLDLGEGRLGIVTSANQDNPLPAGLTPVLGVDVWEHAYYLKHQNRRDAYLEAWWNVVNWKEVNRTLLRARP